MKAGLPCLETARLRLRPCRRDDIDVLHHIWTDPGVRKYVWDDQLIARSQAAEIVEASLTQCAGKDRHAVLQTRAEDTVYDSIARNAFREGER